MVRVKNRYLLVDIMYPTAKQPDPLKPLPDLVLWNQPTTDFLTPGKLVRAIRDVAKDMFGDYGLGALGTLQGMYISLISGYHLLCTRPLSLFSQLCYMLLTF